MSKIGRMFTPSQTSARKAEIAAVATAPEPMKPTAPAPMPDSMSPQVLEAKRKADEALLQRAGRASTILSTPKVRASSETSDSYSSKTLGGS